MRRTYRPKRDGGGLDHKNLISRIDAKSSVFDAFYIENIKLNKKEISSAACSNQINVTSKKVRKRKYVKRIIKDSSQREVDPSGDSKTQSVYLTPDKSIHVNKAPDPFDLLLKSSPVLERPMFQKSPEKLNIKKKTVNSEKCNCSIILCTDSDKENTIIRRRTLSHNTSNVKSHKLKVEVEHITDPKSQDKSISRIVKRMPHLNNINRGIQLTSIQNTHRLTVTNQNSSAAENSPLCSTPFQVKCTSKSIYNISPIAINFNDSSKVFVNTSNGSSLTEVINLDEDENKDSELSVNMQSMLALNTSTEGRDWNAQEDPTIEHKSRQNVEENSLSFLEASKPDILSTSEVEPCYGFSNVSVTPENNANNIIKVLEGYSNEISLLRNSTNPPLAELENMECQQSVHEASKFTNDCFLSDSSLIDENSHTIEKCASKESSGTNSDGDMFTLSNGDVISRNSTLLRTASPGTKISLVNYNNSCKPNLVVALEKMDESLFYKYYEKYESTENDDADGSSHSSNDFVDITNLEEKENPTDLSNVSYNTDWGNDFHSMDSFPTGNTSQEFKQTFESNKTKKEDGGISYVTTRRRNEITNNSIIVSPDNSYGSFSVKADDTEISNNIIELTKTHEDNVLNVTSVKEYMETEILSPSNETSTENIVLKHQDIFVHQQSDRDVVCTSNGSKNSTGECDETKFTNFDSVSGAKVPIVLQPGKKWERSLSIYKRMTTIADSKHSLLDYEDTETKVRKYRQSVINTMEMQKSFCSLHNESINGRRSTFVCKPSRSTIKIVKENRNSQASLCSSTAYEDLKGFLSDDCDDTIVDLSKLSIGDSVHEVTVLEKFHDTSRIATARDYVLRRCNQTEPILFDECYPDTELKNCHKIGEGVYGEVFLWRARAGEARVLKVIPIAGDIKVNGEPQKGYHEIISEIVIAMELSALRAPIADIEKHLDEGKELDALDLHSVENATDIFNEVLAVRCVRGAYPARLLELWELYDECRGSDNDNPAALPPAQHFLVLELRNAGRDLESYSFTGADQAHAVFLQLAFGLAVAEEALQFEHRDLHWGNVLVSPTDQKYATFVLRGRVHRVARRGATCAVIDYSLSRLSLRGAALYTDLADDDSLFDAVGDRQFDVYRLMRDRLGNEWKSFEPYTNVLWLHYVADKMVTALRYERPATKLHRHYLAKLKGVRGRVLDYASAAAFVLGDPEL